MTTEVRDILNAARALPPQEQLELLEGLVHSLTQRLSPLGSASAAFWQNTSLDQLLSERKADVVSDPQTLRMKDWPSDEELDDLIAFVHDQRLADHAV